MIKKIIGWSMVVSLFAGIFVFVAIDVGIVGALLIFALVMAILVFLKIGVDLFS